MSRRGENIYKRKDGRWEGRYIKGYEDSGKAIYGYIYAKNYGEVKLKIAEKKVEVEEQKKLRRERKREEDKFYTVAAQWYAFIYVNNKKSTMVKYQNLLQNHILPFLGNYHIDEIQTSQLEEFAMFKIRCGRIDGSGGLSAKTVKNMLTVIGEILQYAGRKSITVGCCIQDIRLKVSEKKLQILNHQEQDRLGRYLLENENPKNIGILISLYMGLRIGEICALKWKGIRLEEHMIRIHATMQRVQNFSDGEERKTNVIITPPKSEAAVRDIPIPNFLLPILKRHKPQSEEAFLLTGKSRSFYEPRSFQYYFKRVLENAGIPEMNFHVLRHTFATRCIEAGFDMKSLSEILGHSTVNITLNRYVHISMEMKQQNMGKMAVPEFFS